MGSDIRASGLDFEFGRFVVSANPVKDRGIVITGAGRGIGRAIAARLKAEGARVVVNDLNADAAHAVAADIGAVAIPGDAASEAGVGELVDRATSELGRIDIFVANAGVDAGRGLESTESEWARSMDVNVMAHVRAARLLVPMWVQSGGGRFIVTASAAGLLTMLEQAPYSVSKHAAVAFAEWLSATYGTHGVVVQAICPLGVDTDMVPADGPIRDLLSHDGLLAPDDVADAVWEALHGENFLVLPHPTVRSYYAARAGDTDAWLRGMRRIQSRLDEEK